MSADHAVAVAEASRTTVRNGHMMHGGQDMGGPAMDRRVQFMVLGQLFECPMHYQPLKPIGKGAYGVVCSARHLLTGETRVFAPRGALWARDTVRLCPPLPATRLDSCAQGKRWQLSASARRSTTSSTPSGPCARSSSSATCSLCKPMRTLSRRAPCDSYGPLDALCPTADPQRSGPSASRHAARAPTPQILDLWPPADWSKFEDVYIVYEIMDTDLHQIIKSNQDLTDEHCQYFIYQILRGLKFIHRRAPLAFWKATRPWPCS